MNKINEITSEEEIEIYSLIDLFQDQLTHYRNSKGVTYPLTNIRAIVLHQSSDINKDVANEIVPELISSKKNPYHYIISGDGKIYQLNNIDVSLNHIRSKKYTKKANEYFGDNICPIYKDTDSSRHPEASPDNCTISILLPKLDENGDIGVNASNSLIKLCAYIINKYAKALQAPSNVLCAYEVSTEYDDPICFKKSEENYTLFKYEIEKKRSKWYVYYGGIKRGYCSETVYNMKEKTLSSSYNQE